VFIETALLWRSTNITDPVSSIISTEILPTFPFITVALSLTAATGPTRFPVGSFSSHGLADHK